LSYLLSAFLIIFSVFIMSKKHNNYREPSSDSIDVEGYIEKIPNANAREGAHEYAKQVGLEKYESIDDLGDKNYGMVYYNRNLLLKNKCFKDLASNFYEQVINFEEMYMKRVKEDGSENSNYGYFLHNNTSNTPVNSGWVWDLAMKTAKDSNLAMMLIGLCGHDNAAQLDHNKCHEHVPSGNETTYERDIA